MHTQLLRYLKERLPFPNAKCNPYVEDVFRYVTRIVTTRPDLKICINPAVLKDQECLSTYICFNSSIDIGFASDSQDDNANLQIVS